MHGPVVLPRPLRSLAAALLLACALVPFAAGAAAPAAAPAISAFSLDPHTVQRWQAGWRHPQAGWTVVHIEGAPYERGLQHGHLLAAEIADYIRALSAFWGPNAPAVAWEKNRQLSRLLFGKSFSAEQLQEMQGIADGASAEGARIGTRRIEVLDIITLNAANELDSLDDALAVTPDGAAYRAGLTPGQAARTLKVVRRQRQRPRRCNAFLANGAATPDGRILAGHITMYDLYPANFYNVWMEVVPTTGYRFVMQTTPGGIHSSMDYSINAAGMLLTETTLDQGPLVVGGSSLAARIRQAQQYADSIDSATAMLTRSGNGLSSAEWLMGDLKTNEIALLTLGAGNSSTLRRSSRKEWFAGAEGFYWSTNNTKEQNVRLQAGALRDGRPSAAATFSPNRRDEIWLRNYREHKGRMDLDFARKVLATPEIVSAYGVDAKVTDASLAGKLQSWGAFGPPVGTVWPPTPQEARQFPAIRPLVHNPWTLLELQPPSQQAVTPAADRADPRHLPPAHAHPQPRREPEHPPVWQGTLLPVSDADIWLSTAFANYERIVALEYALRGSGGLQPGDLDDLAVEVAYYRSIYGHGVRVGKDVPLAQTRSSMDDMAWYNRTTGKGVLFLHTLRGLVGAPEFDKAMRDFGRQYAGKPVSTAAFQAFLQARTQRPLAEVFAWWTQQTGLPHLALESATARPVAGGWETVVALDTRRIGPALPVPVTVETASGSRTQTGIFDANQRTLRIVTPQRPVRVVVDKYGSTARDNGSPFTILTMDGELEKALIVYGTQDEASANLEAAQLMQHALRRREHNVQPEIRADTAITEAELASHHLLLVGRPATNAISRRFAGQMGVAYGSQSFGVRGKHYIHPETATLAAADNPLNPRYSIVIVAGLGSLGTYQTVGKFADDVLSYAPVVVLPWGREQEELVPPLPELTVVPRFMEGGR